MNEQTGRDVVMAFVGVRGSWLRALDAVRATPADELVMVSAEPSSKAVREELAELGAERRVCRVDDWASELRGNKPRRVFVSVGRAELLAAVVRLVVVALGQGIDVTLLCADEV